MKRRVLIGVAVVQMVVVWLTVVAWPHLFIPAMGGFVAIAAAIPEETR